MKKHPCSCELKGQRHDRDNGLCDRAVLDECFKRFKRLPSAEDWRVLQDAMLKYQARWYAQLRK